MGTVVALWLATLMSARMSYRAIHGKGMPLEKYREIFFSASGLLTPALVPILLVIASKAGAMDLSTALLVSMIVLLASMFLFSVLGSRRIYDSPFKIFVISVLEMGIGVGVVAIKLLAGE